MDGWMVMNNTYLYKSLVHAMDGFIARVRFPQIRKSRQLGSEQQTPAQRTRTRTRRSTRTRARGETRLAEPEQSVLPLMSPRWASWIDRWLEKGDHEDGDR